MAAKTLSILVVLSEQYPKGLGTTETMIINQLPDNTPIVEKTSFSCANTQAFMDAIKATGRTQIVLTGMETHICILQTALDYAVFVIEDAVSSRSKANQYNALQRLRHTGVVISNVESVLFEWLGDARHPDFKAISKSIV